jgi:hypothetical protein
LRPAKSLRLCAAAAPGIVLGLVIYHAIAPAADYPTAGQPLHGELAQLPGAELDADEAA